MGIIVIRKRNVAPVMTVKALGEKLSKEIEYFGKYSGVMVTEGTEIFYRRAGKNLVAELAPLSW